MEPLVIYAAMAGLLLVASLLVAVFRHVTTRKCPLCEAQVEMGRTRCQACDYRFSTARY
jgi:hypothetical protein